MLHLFYFVRLDTSLPRGAEGSVTFRLRYLLLPHPPPAVLVGLWEVFGMTFPCLGACVSLHFAFLRLAPPHHTDGTQEAFDDGFPCHSAFSGGLFTVVPFPLCPPAPATPAVRGRFFMCGLPYCRVCVSSDCFFPRFLAS